MQNLKKLTSLLVVDDIEANLPFWLSIGFEQKMALPDEKGLAFVILESGTTELMLQSRASVAKDVATIATHEYRSALYIEVADLGAIETALGDRQLIFERRTTFYGATEVATYDPVGNVITFSQFA